VGGAGMGGKEGMGKEEREGEVAVVNFP